METTARFSALSRRDLPPGEYAREFCRLVVCTALDDARCSGTGPTTITPWTSQTPRDYAGGKGSSGVWRVSCTEPEPARRPARQLFPSQVCQPIPSQGRLRPRLTGHHWHKPVGCCYIKPAGSPILSPHLSPRARSRVGSSHRARSRVSSRPWARSSASSSKALCCACSSRAPSSASSS